MPEIVPLQNEFPLRVAVCAWCKPKNRRADLGALGSISHGICPRHLKNFMLDLQMKKNAGQVVPAMVARPRRRAGAFNHPELNYAA